jgi:methylthioribose-1-phosphate isomerase
MPIPTTNIVPLRWEADRPSILDQRRLPLEEVDLDCATVEDVADAIRTLAVRGAPLIGIAAAYGLALAARATPDREALRAAHDLLAATRPTAVNLFWALSRCWTVVEAMPTDLPMTEVAARLLAEARAIHAEDAASCVAMAEAGLACIPEGARILTHCNAGALATGGIGTALGVIRAAHAAGRVSHVWVDETRPLLQGARLTAWELERDAIPYSVQTDSMAAALMAGGNVDLVIVGADRIARNGDTANKIGTYGLAVLARAHGVPFYVAAPWSTVDRSLADGTGIPVEQRRAEEVLTVSGVRVTPPNATAWNPAFDVTPGVLITAFITDRGMIEPPLDLP